MPSKEVEAKAALSALLMDGLRLMPIRHGEVVERDYRVVSEYIAALEAAEAVKWQPIETAPKDGSKFLILTRIGEVLDGWRQKNHQGFERIDHSRECYSYFCLEHEPTHWQPLPQPPKEGDK